MKSVSLLSLKLNLRKAKIVESRGMVDAEEGKGRGGEGLKQRGVYGRRECGGQARKGRAVCAGDPGGGAGWHPHLPARVSSLQELLQAKQDLQHLLIAKEEQEDLLRKRERELTALKGALKEEVSSHDQEMDRLKEQYDAELRALQESVEEATKVGPGRSAEWVSVACLPFRDRVKLSFIR